MASLVCANEQLAKEVGMLTLLIVVLILFIIPAKLSKLLFRSLFGWMWRGSTLKMVVEAGGQKLKSFKDGDKKNQEGNG